jgi:nucleoside 2-deoxyribosyltransferase
MNLLRGVYLAGPMAGFTGEEMKKWRSFATAQLETSEVPCLDPTRRISFHEQCLEDGGLTDNIAQRIFRQDLRDIARCEVLLADMRDHPNAKGQGTAAEIMFAHMKHKIIIMFKNPEDKLNPFMTAMATEVHDSLQDAIDAAIDYSL